MESFDVEELIKQAKIAAMEQLVAEALASGISTRSFPEILRAARDHLKAEGKLPTE